MKTGRRTIKGITLLAVAAGLITAGVMREELVVVFFRAVHVCLECIGLG
ncbi:MAG: CD1871A family CXXC motif-containing protein [Bacillota bacterium]